MRTCSCGGRIARHTAKQCRACYRKTLPGRHGLTEANFRLYAACGYWRAHYTEDGKHRTITRARWRWIEANGPIFDDGVVVHVSDDRTDDRLENLDVATKAEALSFVSAARRMPHRQCPHCQTWKRMPEKQKHCSVACRKASARETVQCKGCGDLFECLSKRKQKHCSVACAKALVTAAAQVTKMCPSCGRSFTFRRSDRRVYCSLRCSAKGKSLATRMRRAGEL